jgi:hypothetical protein
VVMSTFRGSEEYQPFLSLLITTDRYNEETGVTSRQEKWTAKEWRRRGIMVQRLICPTDWRETRSTVPEPQSGQFKPRLALPTHCGEERMVNTFSLVEWFHMATYSGPTQSKWPIIVTISYQDLNPIGVKTLACRLYYSPSNVVFLMGRSHR